MWRPLLTHTCLFTAMADSCSSRSSSSSSEEEYAILLGALAVLQQIDEEKKDKLKNPKRWWVRPWIARHFVWMNAHQFQYLLDSVSPLIIHKDTPTEPLAVKFRFLATGILHNYVNVLETFQLFDCLSINVWLGFSYYRLLYTH